MYYINKFKDTPIMKDARKTVMRKLRNLMAAAEAAAVLPEKEPIPTA